MPATRGSGGLGLGLHIAKHLFEHHGGSIEAQSDGPGHDAVFTVELPLAERGDAPLVADGAVVPSLS